MNVKDLESRFRGEILTAGSAEYETSRKIWNSMIDRRPHAIARCRGREDVQAAVRFAAEQNIYPAIRAGGHNAAGLAMIDDGLVIDVSPMKELSVNAPDLTAIAQSGLTWGEFDSRTHAHSVATTGGLISTTGIAGLTLGGGVGWLMGRCGLVCDNTLNYDIVLASGELVRANSSENQDLFWALKGGGGNFGVVTSITYRMYPIREVVSGLLVHRLADARDVLRFYRDFTMAGLPDELIVYAAALCLPDGTAVVALIPAWCGESLAEGERVLEPLRKFGSPIADMISRMPYPAMQQMVDMVAPYGLRSYWKARFLKELPDEVIERFVEFANTATSPRSLAIIEHAHGAVGRVPVSATAFPTRTAPYDLVLIGAWTDVVEDARHIDWTRRFYASMDDWAEGTVYVNALDQDDTGRIAEAYGPNYARLRDVKARYDPENRFRRNQNILPVNGARSGRAPN
ncbi:MAG TPA: FAD-binding oxidoreductase [Terracidiphilus sp.]